MFENCQFKTLMRARRPACHPTYSNKQYTQREREGCVALHGNPSQSCIGIIQCYLQPDTGEHAVPLRHSQAGRYLNYPPQRDGRLRWHRWLDIPE